MIYEFLNEAWVYFPKTTHDGAAVNLEYPTCTTYGAPRPAARHGLKVRTVRRIGH
jgi:hypothetical protein